MAVDTRDKRGSAMALGFWDYVLPNPDGAALNVGDRQQTAATYRGISSAVTLIKGATAALALKSNAQSAITAKSCPAAAITC